MPTEQPFRNYFQLEATDVVWWSDDPAHGSWLEHDPDVLVLTTDTTVLTKAALKFDIPASLPDWITRGPISSKFMGIGFNVISPGSEAGSSIVLKAAPITSAWNSSSSLVTMRAITTGASIDLGSIVTRFSGLDFLHSPSTETNMIVPDANGIMLYLTATYGDTVTISTLPTIVIRYYYKYDSDLVGSLDSTERTDISNDVRSMLRGEKGYEKIVISVNGLKENVEPSKENASIHILKGAGSRITRKMNYPTPWKPAYFSAGALSVSTSESSEVEKASGSALETTVELVDFLGISHVLAKQRQISRSSSLSDTGKGELALASPIQAAMDRSVTLWDPQGQLSQGGSWAVEYADRNIMYILTSIIQNASLLPFKYYYYNDIAALRRRFNWVWTWLTLSRTDIDGLSVGEMWNTYAPMLGLHAAEMADGCWSIFHPGVRRGSLRIWYLKGRSLKASFQIIEKSRTEANTSVVVSAGSDSSEVFPALSIHTSEDWRESPYPVATEGEIFYSGISGGGGYDFEFARKALGNQLAQYVCGKVLEVKGILGLEFVDANCGDQLIVDSSYRDMFLAIITEVSLDPNTLRTSFTALHYMEYQGLHSVFTRDGILGLWRIDDDNEISSFSADPDWVTPAGGAVETTLQAHWQGKLNGGFLLTNTDPLLNDVANYSDTFDLTTGGMWELNYADDGTALPSWWNDPEVVPFMMWRRALGTETLVFGMRRPGYPSGSVKDNMISLIHYTTMISSGFTGATYFSAPPGILGVYTSAAEERDFLPASIAFSWKDDYIRLYLERKLILETNDATIFDKTVWDNVLLHGSKGGPYPGSGGSKGITQTMIASLTHIGQDGWIENLQRLNGANGIDPFYGPDDISVLVT